MKIDREALAEMSQGERRILLLAWCRRRQRKIDKLRKEIAELREML